MARAAFAARGQLLTRLRPHAERTGGLAPLELLPEVCGNLRAFTPPELRLVLAAYNGHPPNDPALRLHGGKVVAAGHPPNDPVGKSVRLHDVLVQLLVGGSRLGTAPQLLAAADSVAKHGPCDCDAASEFWVAFAERVSRLAAGNSLTGLELAGILASCATWRRRCGATARPWPPSMAHVVRSIGGRLADPERLSALDLKEAVGAARDAVECGQPQLRLAASIGVLVGKGAMEQLSAEELIDLIGAAGALGGRLHMMTRAIADHIEPQVATLPAASLVRLCSHLGALEMFPQHLADALAQSLPASVPLLPVANQIELLRASGRLRWRVPAILEPLLEALRLEVRISALRPVTLSQMLYELYRLDLWDEELVVAACAGLNDDSVSVTLSPKAAANALLALTYFIHPAPELCHRLFCELVRSQALALEATTQLKTIEMAMRVGHGVASMSEMGGLISRWLFNIRSVKTPPEATVGSDFAESVSAVAQQISWRHVAEVEVGPYKLDFAAVAEDEESEVIMNNKWDEDRPARSLLRFGVALEVDGPSHFYRPHGAPWHWTSSSKMRHRLLSAAGVRVAHVPYYDWAQLEDDAEREAYLWQLLLDVQKRGQPSKKARLVPHDKVHSDIPSNLRKMKI